MRSDSPGTARRRGAESQRRTPPLRFRPNATPAAHRAGTAAPQGHGGGPGLHQPVGAGRELAAMGARGGEAPGRRWCCGACRDEGLRATAKRRSASASAATRPGVAIDPRLFPPVRRRPGCRPWSVVPGGVPPYAESRGLRGRSRAAARPHRGETSASPPRWRRSPTGGRRREDDRRRHLERLRRRPDGGRDQTAVSGMRPVRGRGGPRASRVVRMLAWTAMVRGYGLTLLAVSGTMAFAEDPKAAARGDRRTRDNRRRGAIARDAVQRGGGPRVRRHGSAGKSESARTRLEVRGRASASPIRRSRRRGRARGGRADAARGLTGRSPERSRGAALGGPSPASPNSAGARRARVGLGERGGLRRGPR